MTRIVLSVESPGRAPVRVTLSDLLARGLQRAAEADGIPVGDEAAAVLREALARVAGDAKR